MRQYSQLTQEQRYQISAMKQAGHSQIHIARHIGVSGPTISRECRRNGKVGKPYCPQRAHGLAAARLLVPRRPRKLVGEVLLDVNKLLKEEWSPEQIEGRMLSEGMATVCMGTIYAHTRRDRLAGGTLYKHLRRKGKRYRKPGSGKKSTIVGRVSIDERPAVVDERSRIGDWEGDTMIGAGRSSALMTMVERHSRYTIIVKCDDRTSTTISNAICDGMRRYKSQTHTITVDNGCEFARHIYWGKQLKADVYFAHPYSSWERGLNENTNGLIRQYAPKGTRFEDLSDKDIRKIQDKLNSRPRKSLGYRTPKEVFWNERYCTCK